MDINIQCNTGKLKDLTEINERIDAFTQQLNSMVSEAKQDIVSLKEIKLDQTIFNEGYEAMKAEVETIKFASQDNFRNLLHTDNYLEKYLPFKI